MTDGQKALSIALSAIALLLGGYLLGSHSTEKANAELKETLDRQLAQRLNPLEQRMQGFDSSLGQVSSRMVTQDQLGGALTSLSPQIRANVAEAVKRYGVKPEQVASALGNFNFTNSGSSTGSCDATRGEYSFRVKPDASPYAVTRFTDHCSPNAKSTLTLNMRARFDQVTLAQDPHHTGFLKTSLTSLQLIDVNGNLISTAEIDPSSSFRYTPDSVPAREKRFLLLGSYTTTGYGIGAYYRLRTWPILVGGGFERGTQKNPNRVGVGIGFQF